MFGFLYIKFYNAWCYNIFVLFRQELKLFYYWFLVFINRVLLPIHRVCLVFLFLVVVGFEFLNLKTALYFLKLLYFILYFIYINSIHFMKERNMKVLVVGMLGSGKSGLAYDIENKYKLSKLNLDKVCRRENGVFTKKSEQIEAIERFVKNNDNWVIEGCQKHLYEKIKPDIVVNVDVPRIKAVYNSTIDFIEKQKTRLDDNQEVKVYRCKKPILKKIIKLHKSNGLIKKDIRKYLIDKKPFVVEVKKTDDYSDLYRVLDTYKQRSKYH